MVYYFEQNRIAVYEWVSISQNNIQKVGGGGTDKGGSTEGRAKWKVGSRLSEIWITDTDYSSCLRFVQEQCFLSSYYKFILLIRQ
jgi:hypothetical protein